MKKEKDLQTAIGNLLRIGVWSAIAVSVLGIFFFLSQQSNLQFSAAELTEHPEKFSLRSFLAALANFDANAVLQLSILILLATPILRVVFAIVGYLVEKDRLYALISAIVLAIIIAGYFIGLTH